MCVGLGARLAVRGKGADRPAGHLVIAPRAFARLLISLGRRRWIERARRFLRDALVGIGALLLIRQAPAGIGQVFGAARSSAEQNEQ